MLPQKLRGKGGKVNRRRHSLNRLRFQRLDRVLSRQALLAKGVTARLGTRPRQLTGAVGGGIGRLEATAAAPAALVLQEAAAWAFAIRVIGLGQRGHWGKVDATAVSGGVLSWVVLGAGLVAEVDLVAAGVAAEDVLAHCWGASGGGSIGACEVFGCRICFLRDLKEAVRARLE